MRLIRALLGATVLLVLSSAAQAQTFTQMQWGIKRGVTPSDVCVMNATTCIGKIGTFNLGTGVFTPNIPNGIVTAAMLGTGAAIGNIGFTPLSPANNLSEIVSQSSARTNLGLGSIAVLSSTAATDLTGTWPNVSVSNGAITNVKMASGAAVANIGFTPVSTAVEGIANGIATLDPSGFVPLGQLPPAVAGGLAFQGSWNANTNAGCTNCPLASSVGTTGQYYFVSVSGSTTLNGVSSWTVGDLVLFSSGIWNKIPGGAGAGVSAITDAHLTGVVSSASLIASGGLATSGANSNITSLAGGLGSLGIGVASVSLGKVQVQAVNQGALSLTTSDFASNSAGSVLYFDFGASTGNTYSRISALNTGGAAWNNLILQSFAGRVGIGTVAPGYMLDVAGDINTTGTFRINGTPYSAYTASGTGAVASTIATKLGESISVQDFGAVCDGATDDGSSFQKAVTRAVAVHGVVAVPNTGSSCVVNTTVSLPSGTQIAAAGGNGIGTAVANILTTANVSTFVTASNATNISIRGLYFKHTGSGRILDLTNAQAITVQGNSFLASGAGTGEVIYTNGSNTSIDDNFFNNSRASQWTVNFDRTTWGINANNRFTRNLIQGSGQGARIGAVSTSITGTTTATSTTVSSVSSTVGLTVNGSISGAGIPTGTTISSIGVGSLVMSAPATASASGVAITADQPRPEGIKFADNSFGLTGFPALQIEQVLLFQSSNDTFDTGSGTGNAQINLASVGSGIEAVTFQGDWLAIENAPVSGLCLEMPLVAAPHGSSIVGLSVTGSHFNSCGFAVDAHSNLESATFVGNIFETSGSGALNITQSKIVTVSNNVFRSNAQDMNISDGAAGGPFVVTGNQTNGVVTFQPTITMTTPSKFNITANPGFTTLNQWTAYSPGVSCSSGAVGTGAATGAYKMVDYKTVAYRIRITGGATFGCNYPITALPFTAAAASVVNGRDSGSIGAALAATINSGSPFVTISRYDNSSPGANNAILDLAGTYEIQ